MKIAIISRPPVICIFQTLAPFGGLLSPWLTLTSGEVSWGRYRCIWNILMRLTLVAQAAHPALLAETLPCLLTCAVQAAGEGHTLVTVLSLPPWFTPQKRRKMEQARAINIPPTESCSPALIPIMSASFFFPIQKIACSLKISQNQQWWNTYSHRDSWVNTIGFARETFKTEWS